MKWLLWTVLGVVVLANVAVVAVVLLIDPIAKKAVESGGTYALGVDTRVEKMSVGLTSGDVKMEGLRVANPEGFKSDHLMKTGTVAVSVQPMSVLGSLVEVRTFELDGLDINVEQAGLSANVTKVMDNLKKLSSSTPAREKKETPSGGTKVKVTNITIKNTVARFHLGGPLAGKPVVVKVPLIEMKDVTGDNAKGVAIHELYARVLPAVLAGVFDSAKGLVPGGFLTDMNGQLKGVSDALGGQVGQLMGQTSKQFGEGLNKFLGDKPADALKKPLEGLLKPSH